MHCMPNAPTNGAKIIGSSNAPVRYFFPANSNRSDSHASGSEISTATNVEQIAIFTELRSPSR